MATSTSTWSDYLKSFVWAPEPMQMQMPAQAQIPVGPVEFSDFAFKMNEEREKNYQAEREAYEFTGQIGALVLKKELGDKVTVGDFNALFSRLPINKTYNIDALIGIPRRMLDVIPFLQRKNYRLDQPVFYHLLTELLPDPDLLAQIFTPQLYSL